jgi:hypothetical protein
MRNHGMSARRRRRLGTRQEGDSLGHGTRRSSFLAPPAQSFCRVARPQIGKGPVEAAGAADAKNAPTAPWETGRPVFHSYHRLCLPALVTGRVSPMFPVNFVTDVPGCTAKFSQNFWRRSLRCTARSVRTASSPSGRQGAQAGDEANSEAGWGTVLRERLRNFEFAMHGRDESYRAYTVPLGAGGCERLPFSDPRPRCRDLGLSKKDLS